MAGIRRRWGILGGTFNPPHYGHLILAQECQFQLGLERLLWVVTPNPPHKHGQMILPVVERLEMVRAAIAGNPAFELSRVDVDRPPPHYALETVRMLHKQFPQVDWVYLMGGDSLRDLPTWSRPLAFLEACTEIGVMHRPENRVDLAELEDKLPGVRSKVRFVLSPLLEISSEEIRRRVACGEPYRYFLPENVSQIIQQRGHYQSG